MMEDVRWLWRQSAYRGIRLSAVARIVAGVVRVAVLLLFIFVCKHMVDIATGAAEGSIMWWAFAMGGCVLSQLAIGAAVSRMGVAMNVRMSNALRYRLFSHVMRSRWCGREGMHSGDMLERMKKDVDTVTDLVCASVPTAVVTAVQLVAAFVFLAVLNVRLAVVLVLIMPLAILAGKRWIGRMRRLTRDIRATDSDIHAHIQEHLRHRWLDASLERTGDVVSRLDEMNSSLERTVMSRNNYALFSRTAMQAGFACGYATAFMWGVFGLYEGAITFGVMTAFLQLVGQIQRPAVELAQQVPVFVYAVASVERLRELDAMPLEDAGVPVPVAAPAGLRFENVTFGYGDGARAVLSDLSCDFAPGTVTALLGSTGAGKSTLMRLMLALVSPERGNIVIYNSSGERVEVSPRTRANIVYVPQGNTLLWGSVRDNLLMGNPEATESDMRDALQSASAEFVYDLPNGLDTICGEGGAGLSEGQAQRIAIARGLLRPGSILLLDEPTSALDADTERVVMARLTALPNRTVIVVTHREAVARMGSRVVELGT